MKMDKANQDIETIMQNPGKHYDNPEEVIVDEQLDIEQKRKILENWLSDQKALSRADNENMAEQPGPQAVHGDDPAVMMAKINRVKEFLSKQ